MVTTDPRSAGAYYPADKRASQTTSGGEVKWRVGCGLWVESEDGRTKAGVFRSSGEVRSDSTDHKACWFIDTEYHQESFFVRHAYFTGGDKPYERHQKTLCADIDEDAWATLYSTVSPRSPSRGRVRIAVKVINHYGDEVMKVYEVG